MSRLFTVLGILLVAVLPARGDEPRLDAYGDPLPAGALARLGTLRFCAAADVRTLVFAPDGKSIVSGAADGVIRFWDLKTGVETRRLTGHEHGIISLAFSPDGKTLASGSHDNTARLWDVAGGKQLHSIRVRKSWVTAVAFAPDGKTLAVASRGDIVTLHDVGTGEELRALEGHGIWVTAVVFSKDGKEIFTGAKDRTIRRWDAATGKELARFEGQSTMVYALALAPDGKTLASASNDQAVHLWDAAKGERQRKLEGHTGSVYALAWSADGRTLASASRDGSVRLWDLASDKEPRVIAAEQGELTAIAIAPDGRTLASAGRAQTIRLWETATGQEMGVRREGHSGGIYTLAFTPDGKELITSGRDRTLRVWTSTGTHIRTIDTQSAAPLFFTLSGDGAKAAALGEYRASVWTLADSSRQDFKDINTTEVVDLTFSAEAQPLAWFSGPANRDVQQRLNLLTNGNYHDLELRSLADGRARQRFELDRSAPWTKPLLNDPMKLVLDWPGHTGRISAVAVSHSRLLVASGDTNKSIVFWEAARGKLIRKMLGHEGGIASLAFSPDDRLLISTATDGALRLWETASRSRIDVLVDGKSAVRVAVLSPDGRTLAWAGGSDPRVRLRDIVLNRELPPLVGHADAITSLAFAPDGKTLVSGSSDTTVLLWEMAAVARKSQVNPDDLIDLPNAGRQWEALASDDGGAAYTAVWTLLGSKPDQVLALFKQHLKLDAAKQRTIAQWIGDLDAEAFQTRRSATETLENMGELARQELLEALQNQPSFEMRRRLEQILATLDNRKGVPAPNDLRQIRVVLVLEWLGTPEAHDFLQALAKGPATWWQTREAKAALARLERRK